MHILIRLPNWLGDLVMSTAFVRALAEAVPGAVIDVIVKKGIDGVVDYLPGIRHTYVFDKQEYPGLKGAFRFGRMVGNKQKPDIMYCLPESLSSAVMAVGTGARKRFGYRKELRSFLLSATLPKNESLHRVDQYLQILTLQQLPLPAKPAVFLQSRSKIVPGRIIINVNSEAESRRLPVEKAIGILNLLRASTDAELVLVGSPKEVPHVMAVYNRLEDTRGIEVMAGKTNLTQLMDLLATAPVMLTTDSGPMHLANALGVHTVALEGASDEKNTAPYNAAKRTLIRSGLLSCEPCVKNICKFGVPKCLMNMQDRLIVEAVLQAIKAT